MNITSFKGVAKLKIEQLGDINVFIGKNNSGKSTLLHAIDIAGLALRYSDFSRFQLKLDIEDLFNEIGKFGIDLELDDGNKLKITSHANRNPIIDPTPTEDQKIRTLLVWPDVNSLISNRIHRTPKWVIDQLEARAFQNVNGLQLLHAIQYYGGRNERGLTPKTYDELVAEVQAFFPDISELLSTRTETDVDTLFYK
ncbi:MAG TPA: AAA family ATPase, partial [Amphiplicatus sp.]|nr:AAA family ATPase [Amphiplicatus sp.]